MLAYVLAVISASATEVPDSLAPPDTVWVRPKLDKKRMIASNLISLGLNTGTVQLIKHNVHKLRPDGSNYNSMPSRHAAWAWNLGTRAACQLYSYNPLWASACQLGASIISEQRMMARQHFCSDVFVGSVIGASAATVGQVLGGLVFPGPKRFPPASAIHPHEGFSISVSTLIAFANEGMIAEDFSYCTPDEGAIIDGKFYPLVREKMFGYGTYVTASIPIQNEQKNYFSIDPMLGITTYQLFTAYGENYLCPLTRLDLGAMLSYNLIYRGPKRPSYGSAGIGIGASHLFYDLPGNKWTYKVMTKWEFGLYCSDRLAIGPALNINFYRFRPLNLDDNVVYFEFGFPFVTRVFL